MVRKRSFQAKTRLTAKALTYCTSLTLPFRNVTFKSL